MSVSIKLEKRKIAIIAGEVSGDKIGSDLINEIKSSFDIELCGIGGQELKKQGLKSLFPYDELSIIGIWGIVKNIFTLKNRIDSTVDTINKFNPELLIIIDCPEFTHRVAKKVKKIMPHLAIINYISPTIWFWRQGRGRKMNKYISHILSIYPFEPALYDKLNGPPCTYIGNPLFENIISNKLDNTKIARSKKSVLFMPGSRKTEIEKLLPPCVAAFKEIKKLGYDFDLKIPTFDNFMDLIDAEFANTGIDYSIFSNDSEKINSFWHSDFAVTASGSATLELAACKLPMIVIYKLNVLSFLLTAIILRMNNLQNTSVSLPNIISQTKVIPELLQYNCNSRKIARELINLFNDQNKVNNQLLMFNNVHDVMKVVAKPEKSAADIIKGYL